MSGILSDSLQPKHFLARYFSSGTIVALIRCVGSLRFLLYSIVTFGVLVVGELLIGVSGCGGDIIQPRATGDMVQTAYSVLPSLELSQFGKINLKKYISVKFIEPIVNSGS